MGRSIISAVYMLIGVLAAVSHGYGDINSISALLSFIIAVLLWPALYLGVSLHISLGF
jgi:hypothetical protein